MRMVRDSGLRSEMVDSLAYLRNLNECGYFLLPEL